MTFVPYTPDVEVIQPDEERLTAEIVEIMAAATEKTFDKHRHAIRGAHSKIHGTLVGRLEILPDLPAHLAQGMFSEPATYPVVIRLSSAPGDIRDDKVPAPHGMAVKVIGVPGPKILPGHEDDVTQDFLMVSLPTLAFGDVTTYRKFQNLIAKQDASPEELQRLAASLTHRADQALSHLGVHNPTVEGLGATNDHILGQTFHTMAAIRYGDYIAKLSAAPASPEVAALAGQRIDAHQSSSKLRDLVVDFFREQGAEYELRAQLCTDLETMPVEDASVLWDENVSPHQPIAKIVIPAQDAYSPARRTYSDDVLSFNPWHAIEEHRPLGSIMRIRTPVYESSSAFRHDRNAVRRTEPRDVSEIPD